MSEDSIRVIVTGGTFDNIDEIRGELAFRESHMPESLPRRG